MGVTSEDDYNDVALGYDQLTTILSSQRKFSGCFCVKVKIATTKNNGLPAVDSVFPVEPYLYCKSSPVMIKVRFGLWWWMIRGSNPGHPARLTPYYKVLQDAVRCYLVMLHCSDCNGYKALATGYNTK